MSHALSEDLSVLLAGVLSESNLVRGWFVHAVCGHDHASSRDNWSL